MSLVKKCTHSSEAYVEAKRVLNASAPERIVGRAKESTELEDYLVDCFENANPLSLYINGQPGTGKTLVVNCTLNKLKVSKTSIGSS